MFGYQAHLPVLEVDHQGANGVVSPTSSTWLAGLQLEVQ